MRKQCYGRGNLHLLFLFLGVKGDCEVLKYLEDQSLMTIATDVKKQEGQESICKRGGYCIHL